MKILDELVGFEEAWKGKAQKQLPGWTGNVGVYGNAGKLFLLSHSWMWYYLYDDVISGVCVQT